MLFQSTSFEFKADGTGVQTSSVFGTTAVATFTWQKNGDTIVVSVASDEENETITFTYADNKLIINESTSDDFLIFVVFEK